MFCYANHWECRLWKQVIIIFDWSTLPFPKVPTRDISMCVSRNQEIKENPGLQFLHVLISPFPCDFQLIHIFYKANIQWIESGTIFKRISYYFSIILFYIKRKSNCLNGSITIFTEGTNGYIHMEKLLLSILIKFATVWFLFHLINGRKVLRLWTVKRKSIYDTSGNISFSLSTSVPRVPRCLRRQLVNAACPYERSMCTREYLLHHLPSRN